MLFYPLSHDTLSTNSKLTSGPFPSKEEWFQPIENIFNESEGAGVLFSWILTNPAILTVVILIMIVLTNYYWQRVSLFKEYVEEKQKEVEYTISELEMKYIKCKNMLIRSRL